MMDPIFSIPIHSTIKTVDEEKRLHYLRQALTAPVDIRRLVFSPRTGAYIRGLTKEMRVPEEQTAQVAFLVLQVVLKEIAPQDLAPEITRQLGVNTQVAQRIAADIEKELFAPTHAEDDLGLNIGQGPAAPKRFGQKIKKTPPRPDMPNTLDLSG